MITLLKILIIIGIMLLLAYPLIPAKGKLRNLFPASSLRYDHPDNRKNFPFVILALVEFIVTGILFELLDDATVYISNIPFVGSLFAGLANKLNPQVNFIIFTVGLVLVNVILLYVFISFKSAIKASMDLFFRKAKKKDKKDDEAKDNEANGGTDKDSGAKSGDGDKKRRIPFFIHSDPDEETVTEEDKTAEGGEESEENGDGKDKKGKKDKKDKKDGKTEGKDTDGDKKDGKDEDEEPRYGKIASFIYGLFFEGKDFDHALPWVIRVRTILQTFIILIEVLYVLFILSVLISMFFPLPMWAYRILINTLHIGNWYLYPIISVLFLQEIVNCFRTPAVPDSIFDNRKDDEEKKKAEEEKRYDSILNKLLRELKRHFDAEHYLRYYPEADQEDIKEYEPTNITYKSAMMFIRDQMKTYSGRVVQSYMKCLDACFGGNHVYFASSFYSELGAYLISYTYIRLLSGSRVIYVVSDPAERFALRTFLSERLMVMTGASATNSWRIHTADERLDQADVLIACPGDFRDGNIVAQFPDFFDEVENAIFLDADRMITYDSYLCTVMATRLKKATSDRIRFIFLTQDLYQGFAARSLPKFFCAEPILSFSSARENEAVSYVLWNRESKSHRIYNEHGQKTTSLDYMIADLACEHDIDGVRLLSGSPIDHAERKLLLNYGAEINKFYRDVVDVNYMIYSDERRNLSASIYATTRFRGQKKSVVHILSKPYLLREYFIDKASTENFVNRSSFIQPRVPEHVDNHKLSLLRIFCDVASENGLTLTEFEKRMREVIDITVECGNIIASAFCRKMLASKKSADMTTAELAAYMVAGLCDTDMGEDADSDVAAANSAGHRAKEFYLIFDPAKYDGYTMHREKYIVFNREREVFTNLFSCNDRVELCLNDETIGYVDTFPYRTHLEFIAGQSILYNNSEYEIEHISDDGRIMYLRSENVKLAHCLDTIHLRRYDIKSLTPIPKRTGVLHNTKLTLEEIRVTECTARFTGETYGFYGLSSDKQTLDFYHENGVDGNPHVDYPHFRHITDGRIIKVELCSRMTCTDGMRLLLAATFNEFIRTLFPKTHHAISIVPVLETPLAFNRENEPKTEVERITALYPYILSPAKAENAEEGAENDTTTPANELAETDSGRITLLIINDCFEDAGSFQWFYDLSGRYMQELLANIYSYLHWLRKRPNRNHYIYFGGDALPDCYDLEGCCKLLYGYNRVLAELGGDDIETAGEMDEEKLERCAFCHKEMESGRYSLFDNHRFICAECFEVVDSNDVLQELYAEMRDHLAEKYPNVTIGKAKAALDPVYDLAADQVFSQYYYRVDLTERTIYVERDDPVDNACVSLLRGLIEIWQNDNQLINDYSMAQLYYEELLYLRRKGLDHSADWIYNNLDELLRLRIDEIGEYTDVPVAAKPAAAEDGDTEGDEQISESPVFDTAEDSEGDAAGEDTTEEDNTDRESDEVVPEGLRTSFDFMRDKSGRTGDDDVTDDEGDDFFEDDGFDGLYNPNKVPRFWKRYLRNSTVDDGKDEDLSGAEGDDETETDTETDETMIEDNTENTENTEDDSLISNAPELDSAEEDAEKEPDTEDDLTLDVSDEGIGDTTDDTATDDTSDEGSGDITDDTATDDTSDEGSGDTTDDTATDDTSDEGNGDTTDDTATDDTSDEGSGDTTDDTATDDTSDEGNGKDITKKKKEKKKKNKKKFSFFGFGKSAGEKMIPPEEDEATNPSIRIYNEIIRHAYDYSEEPFDRTGVTDDELRNIYYMALGDYPEVFWVHSYMYSPSVINLMFRCKTPNGKLDKKQIKHKRKELRRAAKTFTRGISRRTDPYKALTTIYRRLILRTDYDMVGLNAGVDADITRDDQLRSLYSILVDHKAVCAGYAVAMQYLLQSVGIVTGYVISEKNDDNTCHAFNILKLGKYLYYMDATWGDPSRTDMGEENRNRINYEYFCVPFEEFIQAHPTQVLMHHPRKDFYPKLEVFHNKNHEYFRYRNAYLKAYNEEEIVRIIAEAADEHDPKEMGEFSAGMRFPNETAARVAAEKLLSNGNLSRLVDLAKGKVKKKKQAVYLEGKPAIYPTFSGVIYIRFAK